jgi:hypothetical protein
LPQQRHLGNVLAQTHGQTIAEMPSRLEGYEKAKINLEFTALGSWASTAD